MFHIGQKVVCVNDRNSKFRNGFWDGLLKKGNIYTIRWTGEFPWEPDRKCGLGVRLIEIHRGLEFINAWDDYPFGAYRFRPIQERKTDISIFTALLNPANHKKLEDA